MSRNHRSFFRYLPTGPNARAWGAYVTAAGHAIVPPGSLFPPCSHPETHHMVWHLGRVLPDYHFLYITQGEGEFESKATGLIRLKIGDLVILHPQMWHRYRPVVGVGWHEYWLEFDGQHARALMNRKKFRLIVLCFTSEKANLFLRYFFGHLLCCASNHPIAISFSAVSPLKQLSRLFQL